LICAPSPLTDLHSSLHDALPISRSIPTPYAVQRFPFQPGATNDYGNPVDGWADPVGVLVHGWAPPSADEVPFEQGRSAVVRDLRSEEHTSELQSRFDLVCRLLLE